MCGDDVTVGVTGIVMSVDEVRFSFEAKLFHVAVGDGLHFFVGEGIGGIEVQGNMLTSRHSFVELLSSFKTKCFILPGEPVGVF
jgi:hypothetical protein